MRARGKEATDTHTDTRILQLRAECGNHAGYGIYRMLMELIESSESMSLQRGRSSAIALTLAVPGDVLEQVIQSALKLGLFEESEGNFTSPIVRGRAAHKEQTVSNRRAGWEKRKERGHEVIQKTDEVIKKVDEVSQKTAEVTDMVSPLTLPSSLSHQEKGSQMDLLNQDPNPLPQSRVSTLHTARVRARLTLAPRIVMTQEERDSLVAEFGEESVLYHAPRASDWLVANGRTKKNYCAFLRNWIRTEIAEQRGFYSPRNRRFGASSVTALPNTAYTQKLAVEERTLARARAMDAGEMPSPFPEPVRRK